MVSESLALFRYHNGETSVGIGVAYDGMVVEVEVAGDAKGATRTRGRNDTPANPLDQPGSVELRG